MSDGHGEHGKAAVIKAIASNAIITVAKIIAAVFSGSGAMLAESIHSGVDTLNQGMLLIGHHRSLLKPTTRFPYGFGPEASFWGLLAAIGVLIFGGALTIEHALEAIAHPEMPDHIWLAVSVLIFSGGLEGFVLFSVLHGLAKTRHDKTWPKHISSQGPGTLTVVLEDSAAVLGCIFALAAIVLCELTQNGIWDAFAQLAIGMMLSVVGVYLIWSNRGLLVGQAISAKELNALRIYIADIDGIDQVVDVKTRQLSAYHYRIKADIVISGGQLARSLIPAYKQRINSGDAQTAAELGRFADDLYQRQAQFIDYVEAQIRKHFPGAVHIDLEPHYDGDQATPKDF